MSFSSNLITNEFALNVAVGRYEGALISGRKYAYKASATTTAIDMWGRTHNLTYATTAETLYLWSDNVTDTAEIELHGLDGNYKYQRATIIANGTTPVAVPGSWLRVNDFNPSGAVSNIGNIFLSTNAGGVVVDTELRGFIALGTATDAGIGGMSHYTVPSGYWAMIKFYNRFAPPGSDVEFIAKYRKGNDPFAQADIGGAWGQVDMGYIPFPPTTDFKIMVRSDSGTINRSLSAAYSIYLIKEEYVNAEFMHPPVTQL